MSFFSNITFDPGLLKTPQAKYLLNFRLVILLIMMIVIVGFASYVSLPRRLNPEIKIPTVIITAVLPGAAPGDIEELVTDPIEKQIKSLKQLDTYSSTSQDNISVISVQFLTGKDPDKAKDEVQTAVDQAKLPDDVQKPVVRKLDFEDQPVWTMAITSTHDDASLYRFVQTLKKRIEDSSFTDRIELVGLDEYEVALTINDLKAKELGVSVFAIQDAISKSLNTYPGGNLESQTLIFPITLKKQINKYQDIARVPLTIQGVSYTIGDVATVRLSPKRNTPLSLFYEPASDVQSTAIMYIYKTSGSNIDAANTAFQTIVRDIQTSYPSGYEIHTIENSSEQIEEQFGELVSEFQSAIFLVFCLLFVFLGLRQAVISSLTFPLTFLSAFTMMRISGLSIDFISLFGFLIALGLLIDDTIVTVTAMTRYFATGNFSGKETGLIVWRDFIVPLWSTTITTIWAFLPLLLSTGIIGEFIKPIPLVVTFNMVSSTSIAVLITLPVMMRIFEARIPRRVKQLLRIIAIMVILAATYFMIPEGSYKLLVYITSVALIASTWSLREYGQKLLDRAFQSPRSKYLLERSKYITANGLINLERVSIAYRNIITIVIKNQTLRRQVFIAIIIFALVGFALVPMGLVKNEFFPKSDNTALYISGDLGANATQAIQLDAISDVMRTYANIPEVLYAIGQSNREQSQNGGSRTVSGKFLITLHLSKEEERTRKSFDIAADIRERVSRQNTYTLTVLEQSGGPPAGADVTIKYQGERLEVLEKLADDTMAYLKKVPGVINVDKSLPASGSRIVIDPKMSEFASNGILSDSLGFAVRSTVSGFTLDKIKIGDEEKDIVFYTSTRTLRPDEVSSITVRAGQKDIPLHQLATLKLEANPSLISREKGLRTVSVTAGVAAGYSVSDANTATLTFAKEKLSVPDGYTYTTGGVNEENSKSVRSIIQAMGLAFLLIFVTMVVEFRSFRQAIMTLLCVPLAVAGVMYIFALTQTALSFPALIGILALFGIVVTTAIVIVEKINENREHGMSTQDAIIEAAGSRLEPIILTSLTTIVGLLPITLADPVWRGLGGAIIAGLLFSGALKLFFIPIVYQAWMQEEE